MLILQLAAACAVSASPVVAAEAPLYKISSGDMLEIVVSDHPELSSAVLVIKDGTVSLPLLGAVPVHGMTVDEARKKLEDLYNANYIVNASVALSLKQTPSLQVYVNGEVKVPGVYPYTSGTTALKAIVTAGGFTEYASKGSVKILRKADGQQQVIKVNIAKIENGAEDVELMPDDVVTVPQSLI